METIEYRRLDRSQWEPGTIPDNEPDKKQWRDNETGLPCLAIRHPYKGHLNGYVAVYKGHSLYKKDYWGLDIDVHGGLTYSDAPHDEGSDDWAIRHVPGEDEDSDVWWFGFDCGHLGDLTPRHVGIGSTFLREVDATYKDILYIEDECKSLAKQLKQLD